LRTQGKNQLLVAATDLNVSLTAELKCTNTSEGGITLAAKNLYELIANAPGDEVTLKRSPTDDPTNEPRPFRRYQCCRVDRPVLLGAWPERSPKAPRARDFQAGKRYDDRAA
jgi:hypothetical protein